MIDQSDLYLIAGVTFLGLTFNAYGWGFAYYGSVGIILIVASIILDILSVKSEG